MGIKRILTDTCCLSNFALIGRFDLLERLYPGSLAVTSWVVAEVEAGLAGLPRLQAALDSVAAGRIEVIDEASEAEFGLMRELPRKFSAADRSCISVAVHRGMVLMTDERAIIKECGRRGVAVARTQDVLAEAVSAGLIQTSELPVIADAMEREAGFRPGV